jgi:cobalamin biosynthesis Mg chelatase CobN
MSNSTGPGVDAEGRPVVDPTQNVLDLVEAAIRRQDDLIEAAIRRQDDLRESESRHVREVMTLRADYQKMLREAESARIDAIRAVDVGAVNRAAEVSAIQASTLAAQVTAAADAARTAVQVAQSAATTELKATVEPLIQAVADLRRAQYEAQGVRSNAGDTRLNVGAVLGGLSVLLVLVFGVLAIVLR